VKVWAKLSSATSPVLAGNDATDVPSAPVVGSNVTDPDVAFPIAIAPNVPDDPSATQLDIPEHNVDPLPVVNPPLGMLMPALPKYDRAPVKVTPLSSCGLLLPILLAPVACGIYPLVIVLDVVLPPPPPEPFDAAVISPLALTVIFALVNDPTLLLTDASVNTFEPLVDTSPDASDAVGGVPPRTMPVSADDDASDVELEKYDSPPDVPASARLIVPDDVIGDPLIENIPDDEPPFTDSPTLDTPPPPPPEPFDAAVIKPLALTVMLAFVNEPTLELTVASVRAFDPDVVASPLISDAMGGEPPRTNPVNPPDDAKVFDPEKYGMPPDVPTRVRLNVPDVVMGEPLIENIPDDEPELIVYPTEVTEPPPPPDGVQLPPDDVTQESWCVELFAYQRSYPDAGLPEGLVVSNTSMYFDIRIAGIAVPADK
jgi:hypothetical protein